MLAKAIIRSHKDLINSETEGAHHERKGHEWKCRCENGYAVPVKWRADQSC